MKATPLSTRSFRTFRPGLLLAIVVLLAAACGGGGAEDAAEGADATAPADVTAPTDAAPAAETEEPQATEEPTQAEAPEELISLSIAEAASGQGGYIMQVVEEFGLDEKHGLDIEASSLSFTEAAAVLGQGEVEVGLIQPSTVVNMAQQGVELEIIAPVLWSGNAFVVPADSTVESIEDLQGETIGNFSPVTGAYFFSAVLAAASGLSIEEDFEQVVAETGALIALLERGDVVAINMFEPHVTKLIVTGDYKVAVDFDSAFEERYGSSPIKNTLGASSEWIEDNPEAVSRVQAMMKEAAGIILAGEDEELFMEIGSEWFGLEGEEQLQAAFERNPAAYVSPDEWTQEMVEVQTTIVEDGIDMDLLPQPESPSILDMWEPVVNS